jgi:hypothetical protein
MTDVIPMEGMFERHRRPAWTLSVLAFAALLAVLFAQPAQAHEEGDNDDPEPIYPLVFPVVGDVYFSDTFGAPRSGHTHEGQDLMSVGRVKGLPVVAAANGTVGWIGGSCCYLEIEHDDGWSTWYIHLNNDTPGTDDGQGWGIAPGIEPGVRVVAGQLIGWLGDSGNAEGSSPHLHFELRDPTGTAVNAFHDLQQATVLEEPGAYSWNGSFRDDDGTTHEANIDKIADAGITKGCNPPANDMFCPDRLITRGEMAAFLRRILDLPSAAEDYFGDDNGTTFEDDINALTAAGIGFGCTETQYCSGRALLRGEMAELLVRAFDYTNPDGTDYFTDDDGHRFEEAINKLRAAEITAGCNPPDNTWFCPDRSLIRAEMATFLVKALDL